MTEARISRPELSIDGLIALYRDPSTPVQFARSILHECGAALADYDWQRAIVIGNFLMDVGNELTRIEQDQNLRSLARTMLVRHVIGDQLPRFRDARDMRLRKLLDEIIGFFTLPTHANDLQPRDCKYLQTFLAQAWWSYIGDEIRKVNVIGLALHSCRHFEFIAEQQLINIVPYLYDALRQSLYVETPPLAWNGWGAMVNPGHRTGWLSWETPCVHEYDWERYTGALKANPELIDGDLDRINDLCLAHIQNMYSVTPPTKTLLILSAIFRGVRKEIMK